MCYTVGLDYTNINNHFIIYLEWMGSAFTITVHDSLRINTSISRIYNIRVIYKRAHLSLNAARLLCAIIFNTVSVFKRPRITCRKLEIPNTHWQGVPFIFFLLNLVAVISAFTTTVSCTCFPVSLQWEWICWKVRNFLPRTI